QNLYAGRKSNALERDTAVEGPLTNHLQGLTEYDICQIPAGLEPKGTNLGDSIADIHTAEFEAGRKRIVAYLRDLVRDRDTAQVRTVSKRPRPDAAGHAASKLQPGETRTIVERQVGDVGDGIRNGD